MSHPRSSAFPGEPREQQDSTAAFPPGSTARLEIPKYPSKTSQKCRGEIKRHQLNKYTHFRSLPSIFSGTYQCLRFGGASFFPERAVLKAFVLGEGLGSLLGAPWSPRDTCTLLRCSCTQSKYSPMLLAQILLDGMAEVPGYSRIVGLILWAAFFFWRGKRRKNLLPFYPRPTKRLRPLERVEIS